MADLLVRDATLVEEITSELQNELGFTVEAFIAMFNKGIINRRNDVVQKVAEAAQDAYLNVELKGTEIIVLSANEAYAEQLIHRAEAYQSLLRMQRVLSESGLSDWKEVFIDDRGRLAYKKHSEEELESEDVIISQEIVMPKTVDRSVASDLFALDFDESFTKQDVASLDLGAVAEANTILG